MREFEIKCFEKREERVARYRKVSYFLMLTYTSMFRMHSINRESNAALRRFLLLYISQKADNVRCDNFNYKARTTG